MVGDQLTDPVKGRVAAAVGVAGGLALLAIERSSALETHRFHPKGVAVATVLLVLGLGGLASPAAAFALAHRSPEAPPSPPLHKALAALLLLAAVGLAFGVVIPRFEAGDL